MFIFIGLIVQARELPTNTEAAFMGDRRKADGARNAAGGQEAFLLTTRIAALLPNIMLISLISVEGVDSC